MSFDKFKNFSVGFDFDGVIHSNVLPTDAHGQRHPSIPFDQIPHIPNLKILNLIKEYYSKNYTIYIITARTSRSKNVIVQTLQNLIY
jgi:hypothetical protein